MITLTLTIGRRPELLAQTLESLLPKAKFSDIIAINDFRDEETNAVFREYCPDGELIVPPHQLGHHRAVDLMYEKVRTPFIFHCEDDWLFDAQPDIGSAIMLLKERQDISSVCFRKTEDFQLDASEAARIPAVTVDGITYQRLDVLHGQWHGYTFNPHLTSIEYLRLIGGFSRFRKERHVSRHLRQLGRHVAYYEPGACHHIGHDDSVSNPAAGNNSKMSRFFKFFGKLGSTRS